MSYLEIIDRVLEKQRGGKGTSQKTDISFFLLSQLAKRNMAIPIYSEVLGSELWLCSNELMALSIKENYPNAITYTVDEMRRLIKLNPTEQDFKRIHNLKSMFNGSRTLEPTSKLNF